MAAAAVLAIPAGMFGLRHGYEHAVYDVIDEHPSFEVRRYAPRIVAEVTVQGSDARAASREGFRLLADYIFGNNVAKASIAMTTPVEQREASETIAMTTPVDARATDNGWTVWFTMPSEHTLDTLPTPGDSRVTLREVPAARFAATRFSGVASADAFERHGEALAAAARAVGLAVDPGTAPTFSQYDPPWTPGPLRRNEVMLKLTN